MDVASRENCGKLETCLSLATSHGNIDESTSVGYSLLCSSLRGLLLCIIISVGLLRYSEDNPYSLVALPIQAENSQHIFLGALS